MKPRPRIGVTGPDRGGFPAWICTWLAVARAGGRAIRLRPGRFQDGQPLPSWDGLILGGGADVDPALYGPASAVAAADEPPRNSRGRDRILSWLLAPLLLLLRRCFSLSARGVDRDRDRFEEHCLRAALAADRPVLGICRGAQFLNIQCGGTLHPELSGFYGEAGNLGTVAPRKRVKIEPGSRLHALLGDHALVNSLHRQAVNRLGKGIVCTARDEAGVIQAIEHPGHTWVLGVQWHPEYLPAMRDQQRLFAALAQAAAQRRAGTATTPGAGSRMWRVFAWLSAGGALATLLLAGWLWWTLLSPFGHQPSPDLPAIDETRAHRVFAHGTLRSAAVRRAVLGRGTGAQPAVLPDHRRDGRRNVVPAPGEETSGLVFEVTADELRRLDRYERLGVRYERSEQELADGTRAWLYRRLQ